MRFERERGIQQETAVQQVEYLANGDRVDRDRPGQLLRGALRLHPEESAQRAGEERQADEGDAPDAKSGQDRAIDGARLQRLFDTEAIPLRVWPWLFVGGLVFFLVVEAEKLTIRSVDSLRRTVTAVEAGA